MESLRTQIDNLQWEVNRLDAENRRLRDGDAEVSARVDLEAELEQSKIEIAQMAERVQTSERQLGERVCAVTEVEQRARRAEDQVKGQEQAIESTQTWLQETAEELQGARGAIAELRDALAASENRANALAGELEAKEDELRDHAASAVRQREAMELERYRAMESVTEKWEARERLLD